jgi:predicted alpha/beta hydrolase
MAHDQPVIPVATGDGHRFELIRVGPENARDRLLFLPGMGLSARLFIPFARALADREIETFIHEWRGNGSSNRRASRSCDWGYRELLDDIEAARAAIVQTGGGQPVLAGHSLGSQLACLSAAKDPARCRGLIVVAGGSPYWKVFPWPMKAVMMAIMFAFPLTGWLIGYYPGKRIGFAGNEARTVMAEWARSCRSGRYDIAGERIDFESALARLRLPVLAIDMADDWFVPRGSLDWLLGKLKRCEVSMEVVEAEQENGKADHYAWMRRPHPTAEMIERWFTARAG